MHGFSCCSRGFHSREHIVLLCDASVYNVKWYKLYCIVLIILNKVHIILRVKICIFNVKINIVLQSGEIFIRTKKEIYYVKDMFFFDYLIHIAFFFSWRQLYDFQRRQ